MSKGSILIVDDNEMLLDMLKNGLSMEGYECESAESAIFALQLIKEKSFDLMITDIDMPEMNGLELVEKMKRLKPDVKAIVMTGLVGDFSWDEAMGAQASDFIKKPFTVKELIARIKQVKMHEELEKREKELKKRVKELEEFYDIAVGRELRIKELKEEIEELKEKLRKYQKP